MGQAHKVRLWILVQQALSLHIHRHMDIDKTCT
jgi:hypothetical protein